MGRDQAADAQLLYDGRSSRYDDSWHPRFARHVVELAAIQPGEHVLDLACGTGLVSYVASTAVGPSGSVTGVDISSGMLAQAQRKQETHAVANVSLHRHSIASLDSLEAIRGQQFDVITCASALVLLEDPEHALKQWVSYLKPGGRLITDVTHPRNQIAGFLLERVGRQLDAPLPSHRLRFQEPSDLPTMMKSAGLSSVEVKLVSQLSNAGTDQLEDYVCDFAHPKIESEQDIDDADRVFNDWISRTGTTWTESLTSSPDVRERARMLFKDEWTRSADPVGKVISIDGVFLGIGWKS